jgi:hypothetical protein
MILSENLGSEFKCTGASISVERITKKFGKVQALDEFSLDVDPGTVFLTLALRRYRHLAQ